MVNQQNIRNWISFVSERSQVILCREKGPLFLKIFTIVSIIFRLFCAFARQRLFAMFSFGILRGKLARATKIDRACPTFDCCATVLMDAVQTQDYYLVNWTSNCYFRLINCNIFANPGTYITSFMLSIQTAWSYLIWYWPNTSGVGQQALSMHNSHNPMKQ